MPITYAVKKVKNPKGIEGTNYFHGQAIKTGELTMDKLARRINNSTTVTQGDCYAVLKSMKEHIIEALTEGQVVVLDDLGRFQVTLQGKSYNAAKGVYSDLKSGLSNLFSSNKDKSVVTAANNDNAFSISRNINNNISQFINFNIISSNIHHIIRSLISCECE